MKIKLILGIFFSFVYISNAQQYNVTAVLISQDSNEKIIGATAKLSSVKDSTDTYFAISNEDGILNLKPKTTGFYKIKIRSVGFKNYEKIIRVNNLVTDLGDLIFEVDVTKLNEVVVTEKVIPVEQHGDTTSMNAAAYKTNPDATAQDLLSKMPGIITTNGKVQAQGEDVKKILVDGKEFFSNDPQLALNSIPAEVIQKIEVFDQQSEQSRFSGFDDGNTTKTINIVTKPETRNGQFGRIYGGIGTDERYSSGGSINFFNEDQRISMLGMTNNTNNQNFSSEDLLGVSSGSAGRRRGPPGGGISGRPMGGSAADNFVTDQNDGISKTQSFGINFDDEINDKLKVNGSYFYNRKNNLTTQFLNRETFITPDSSQFFDEDYISESINNNHRVTMRIEYSIDDKNSIIFTPRLNYQDNKSTLNTLGNTFLSENEQINNSLTNNSNDQSGYSLAGNLLFRHRFEKRGRTISLNINSQFNDQNGNNYQQSVNTYFLNNKADSLNLFYDNQTRGKTIGTRIDYTEPIASKALLQFGYEYSNTWSNSDKSTFDYDFEAEQINEFDTLLSSVFESKYQIHRPTAGIMVRGKKLMMRAGISYQHVQLTSTQHFPVEANVDRSFKNILPGLMMRYKISDTKNLRVFYRAMTDAPSVSQLQDVIDISDPLFLSTGNPNLDQSVTHMAATRFSIVNPEKSTNFFVMGMIRNTADYISNATYIARQDSVINEEVTINRGSQISLPVNLNGYWNARVFSSYGLPLKSISSNLNLNAGLTYSHTPGITNGLDNDVKSLNVNGGFTLASNISEYVDFTLSYRADINSVGYSLQSASDDDYLSQTVTGKVNLIFGKGFVFRSDLSFINYSGYYSEELNQAYAIWNASIAKKFLKDDAGEISLSVFDILKNNVGISRDNQPGYYQETLTNALQQYFLLSFSYKIKNFREG
ncbi:outer membrane beta-barrel protein [Marinigracilibium pacificum]|uniref:Outer membrane beta-barrel protein n=1 Tax=Marinigracilibium pacificum TaxID=2729599 RepID=A0A848IWH5_9BACT|nr:outer membrane beta-barrel protein [Marinigracilibium pacificum]NMM47518.1 outer membrane beta-barrel protein [Marinigracilibium pacificum]